VAFDHRERTMANLVNLKDFDLAYRSAVTNINQLQTMRSRDRAWAGKQAEQFDKVIDVLNNLAGAIGYMVNNNRDGRG
jgi:hypothetical protein